MYQSTYASVAKCIAVMYDKNVSDGDKIQASVLRDCIKMRDNTSHYNCLTYDEATCVIDYVALAWIAYSLQECWLHCCTSSTK